MRKNKILKILEDSINTIDTELTSHVASCELKPLDTSG